MVFLSCELLGQNLALEHPVNMKLMGFDCVPPTVLKFT